MPERPPKRLAAMPNTGRVLLAHPNREVEAIEQARAERCDYFLTPLCPTTHVYVMNVDQVVHPAGLRDVQVELKGLIHGG